MSLRDTILQSCRTWIRTAAARTALADAQVILADVKGPRPALPYLTVKLVAVDLPVGVDELLPSLGATLTVTGGTTATVYTVTINGTVVTYTRAAGLSHAQAAAALATAIETAIAHCYTTVTSAAIVIAMDRGSLTITEADTNLSLVIEDIPVVGVGGQRRATLEVQGFGAGADAWLERMAVQLPTPAIVALHTAAGLSVRALGGMSDLAAMIDTSIEPRFMREFEITYAIRTEPESQVPLALVEATVTLERYDGAAGAFTFAIEAETE